MHPTLEQFCRIPGHAACQSHVFSRTQRELRDLIQPLLDEREVFAIENASLKAQVLALETQLIEASKKARRRENAEVGA